MSKYQRTIKSEVSITGVGLHTGLECTATFKPAEINSGLRFIRLDIENCPPIPADIDHVVDISRGTSIAVDGQRVHTVEHILAATMGMGIDNLIIELTAKEPPVMDGSALPFVEVLKGAGILEQSAQRDILVVDRNVSYSEPTKGIDMYILPSDVFRITFTMDYPQFPGLGTQYMAVYDLYEDFPERIAPARTFCLFSEVKDLKEMGLIKGGGVDNAMVFVDRPIKDDELGHLKELFNIKGEVVAGENGILNGTEQRFNNEAVRHKILDLIGDLALLGMPLQGHIVANRSGHASNIELVRRLKKIYAKRLKAKRLQRATSPIKFDIRGILNVLPHRYPFLLVDRILDVEPGKRVRALKNVTFNEEFFQGHFPGQPVMPGVLVLEAMAQAGGFLLLNTLPNPATKLVYFTAIDKTRFRRSITPGDSLILELELLRMRLNNCRISGKAYVDGEVVAESELMAAIVDRED